MADNNITPHCW